MKTYIVKIYENGNRLWFKEDGETFHREDGPALEHADGTKEWWVDGLLHREDGPALEHADGTKEWWVDGERHREDGPAIEYGGGSRKEWYFNGKALSEEEFNYRKKLSCDGKIVEIDGKKYILKEIK